MRGNNIWARASSSGERCRWIGRSSGVIGRVESAADRRDIRFGEPYSIGSETHSFSTVVTVFLHVVAPSGGANIRTIGWSRNGTNVLFGARPRQMWCVASTLGRLATQFDVPGPTGKAGSSPRPAGARPNSAAVEAEARGGCRFRPAAASSPGPPPPGRGRRSARPRRTRVRRSSHFAAPAGPAGARSAR